MNKVLVVDDDADLLEMVNIVLARQGYTTSAITNGKSFFKAVKSFRPDLILLDIFLGDADGRNLCRQLKAESDVKHIPVILYSAGNVPGSTIENTGADAFVTKPFDIRLLLEKIKSLLLS